MTATREIFEELQVEPRFHTAVGPRPLMVTVTQTQGRSEPHVDVSLWFVFDGSDCASVTPDDPHLPRFIGKLRHRLLA